MDGIKKQVFIKMVDEESVLTLLLETCGREEYKYREWGTVYCEH